MKTNLSPTIEKILLEFLKDSDLGCCAGDFCDFEKENKYRKQWLTDKLQEVERKTRKEVFQSSQSTQEYLLKEKVILRSDLARAIGRMQGLGHSDAYLEKKYPELSHLKSGEEKAG